MAITPAEHLEPLTPIIGRWRTTGAILDEAGEVTDTITGSDAYAWLPGGHWIVHEVDVMMGDTRTQALELIGGRDESSGGWQMHAFDTADAPGVMQLSAQQPGLFLLKGEGMRSWLRPEAGPDHMTTLWEREVDGRWIPWMDVRFDRDASVTDEGSKPQV